ncbi:hypothetical protein RZS08_09320, partial [Arthrospira platensis SPKY1]|nr:hypothetical protein [Arthrospira platensis SPKY1]
VLPPATTLGFDIGWQELANPIYMPLADNYPVFAFPSNNASNRKVFNATPASVFIEAYIRHAYSLGFGSTVYLQQAKRIVNGVERDLLSDKSAFDSGVTANPLDRPEIVVPTAAFGIPNFRAVDIVSRLAAQEGSYFGALFGKGYFVNRYSQEGDIISLSYDDLTELSIETTKEKVGQVTTTLRPFGGAVEPFFGSDIKVKYA